MVEWILTYLGIPLGIALLAYLLLHFQLLILKKLKVLHLEQKIVTKVCISTFVGIFLGVLALSIFRGVYHG